MWPVLTTDIIDTWFERLFYRRMLRMADRAYLEHLQQPQGASHG